MQNRCPYRVSTHFIDFVHILFILHISNIATQQQQQQYDLRLLVHPEAVRSHCSIFKCSQWHSIYWRFQFSVFLELFGNIKILFCEFEKCKISEKTEWNMNMKYFSRKKVDKLEKYINGVEYKFLPLVWRRVSMCNACTHIIADDYSLILNFFRCPECTSLTYTIFINDETRCGD